MNEIAQGDVNLYIQPFDPFQIHLIFFRFGQNLLIQSTKYYQNRFFTGLNSKNLLFACPVLKMSNFRATISIFLTGFAISRKAIIINQSY